MDKTRKKRAILPSCGQRLLEAESAPLPVFSHLPRLRFWALPTLQPHLGAAQALAVGEGWRDPLHAPVLYLPRPELQCLGPSTDLALGLLPHPTPPASGCPHALPGGAGAHVHPSRPIHRPPPMQTRACKYVPGPYLHTLPSRTAFSPRSGPRTPTSKNWREGWGRGRPGSRVRAATASGRSRQPGLRPEGESSLSKETAGPSRPSRARPGPQGVSVPAAPRPGPRRPLISARAVHVSRAPREARGLGLSSSSPAPRRIGHPSSRALPGPRGLEIQEKSGQRRDPCPQPARRGPPSSARRSHATSAQAQRAPSRDRPVGAPWGSATRPFPTRRPQTRPKFPRPPSGRAPTCRAPGFPLLLPGTGAASSSAAEDARPGPAGPCAGSRGEHRAQSHPPRCRSRRRRAPSAVPGGAGWGRSGGGAARAAGAEPCRASGSLCSPESRGEEDLPLPALRGPGRRRYAHSVPPALREAIARRAHHTPPLDPSFIAAF